MVVFLHQVRINPSFNFILKKYRTGTLQVVIVVLIYYRIFKRYRDAGKIHVKIGRAICYKLILK